MEEDGEDLPPFWLESTTNLRRADRYRHRASSLLFSSGLLIILLLVTAAFVLVFIIPSVISSTAQIFRPNTVKKSWDSVNVVLVLFAIIFGFLNRNRNYDSAYDGYQRTNSNEVPKSNLSTPHQWYEVSDRTAFDHPTSSRVGSMRRNSSSYPDLRQASPWVTGDDRWRFSDDTQVDSYRVSRSDQLHQYYHHGWGEVLQRQDSETKNITQEVSSSPPLPPSPAQTPPAAALPPVIKQRAKRAYKNLAHEEKTSKKRENVPEPEPDESPSQMEDLAPSPPPQPSPPPAPPPLPEIRDFYQKRSRSDRKRGGTNATKNFVTSFYSKQKKKRKQRQNSVDNLDAFFYQSQVPPLHSHPPPSTPPPPPPPPPPSVFQNLFSSKKGNKKRLISDAPMSPPPPPPPPPPSTVARAYKARTQMTSVPARTVPVKINSFNSVDGNSSGGDSPLSRIPPPPPLPPFNMPAWKFVVQGDYVRVQSTHSSRSGSPELDDVDTSSPKAYCESPGPTATVIDGGDAPLFCPSPDVDTKADSFIARFRAGLKLEKINSFNQNQGLRMSNLGPGPSPSHS
ncbi:hypothetical protein RJ640_008449 [Escallonia rubra]|uniref:Hydroxyproline-rich glycoprotein family protein n=1 Tax=Escallonia rubra TaxID=112253 RepID=A0AA88TYF6_9ASTE|nr:hypothetical protein RJ640_008449 [Escallonia rubra]